MVTAIIIPTLNEEHNIGKLIEQLKQYSSDIIVADDGSTDRTIEIAQHAGARVVDRKDEMIKGITAAVIDATKGVQTENIIVMDADFQHPPEKVKEIIDLLQKNDIVVAQRKRIIGTWSFMRRWQSRIATRLAYIRIGRNVKDPLSGFFGIKTKLLNNLDKTAWEPRCFKILFAILKSCNNGKVATLDYDFDLRKQDKSKIRLKHTYYFIRNLLR